MQTRATRNAKIHVR